MKTIDKLGKKIMSDEFAQSFGKVLFIIFIFMFMIIMGSNIVKAAPIRVTGRGYTAVMARRDGFRQAIEQQIGVIVNSKTVVSNNKLIADKIMTSSAGLINGYTLIDTNNVGNEYIVVMDVEVDENAIKTALTTDPAEKALVQANLDDPRIAVRVQGPVWGNSVLIELLHNAGFSRVSMARRGPDGFYVDCSLTDVRVNRPRSMGFESDFTATVNCNLRVTDNLGDIALHKSTQGAAWSITAADAVERAQRNALEQVAKELATWLKVRTHSAERHVRIVTTGMTPAEAQKLVQNTSGINRAYIRVLRGIEVHLEADADYNAVDLSMIMQTENPELAIYVSDGSVYIYTPKVMEERRKRREAAQAKVNMTVAKVESSQPSQSSKPQSSSSHKIRGTINV